MQTLWQDLHYGARMLLKQPGFTLIAVLTLALGIGANTAIFSLVNTVLLRPLPIAQPERIFEITPLQPRMEMGTYSYPLYKDLRDQNKVLAGFAAFTFAPVSLSQGDRSERLGGYLVTGNYFDLLGVRAAQGRLFTPDDDRAPGAHPVAVLSYGCWRQRFGGDAGVIGQTVALNNHPFTVIGVAPPEFTGTALFIAPEIYVPMMMSKQIAPTSINLENRGNLSLFALGRLQPNVTAVQAKAAFDALAVQFGRVNPGEEKLRFNFSAPGLMMPSLRDGTLTFAGVVRDSKYFSLGEDPQPFVYFPLARNYKGDVALLARTTGDPNNLLNALREAVRQLDPSLPLYDVKTMREHMRLSLLPLRAGAWVAGGFALLALLLAGLGIYGVMSYVVSQRTRELGIRLALGAQGRDVLRLVLRQGLALALLGLTLGLAGALAVTRLMTSVLVGVSTTDAVTFVSVTLLLAWVVLLACWIPARRATKVDPMIALRAE
ncbi:MAG: ABC transporter permease [Blastocatellia bacterium]